MRYRLLFLALVSLSAPAGGQHLSARYVGDAPGVAQGSVFEGVGDVDGDGTGDIVVGFPLDDTAGAEAGAARVISGADGSVIHQWFGSHAGDRLGWTVSDAGDVDMDGTPDVMVGSPFDNFGAGAAHVFSGASGNLHAYVRGLAVGDRFATAMDTLGDIDGDGHADWAIGAPDVEGQRGVVYTYSGATGSLRHVLTTAPFGTSGMRLGTHVSGVGDVNGDGFDDVLSSTSSFEPNHGGVAYVHSGLDGTLLYHVEGTLCHGICEQIGYGLFRVGDVDGDQRADFAVALMDNLGPSAVFRVRVFSGLDRTVLVNHALPAQSTWGVYGPVAAVGDVDGDGVSELLAAVASDRHELRSGADSSVLQTLIHPAQDIGFGGTVSAVGDIDGDGVPDLGLGADEDDPSGADSGSIYAYSGAAAGPITTYCTSAPNSAGPGAVITAQGSTSLSVHDLVLTATGMPPTQFMLFYYGQSATSVPLGDGFRCIAMPFFRLPVMPIDPTGTASLPLDLSTLPPAGAITAGSLWRFQAWYRDPASGGSGFNLSDAIAVPFRP